MIFFCCICLEQTNANGNTNSYLNNFWLQLSDKNPVNNYDFWEYKERYNGRNITDTISSEKHNFVIVKVLPLKSDLLELKSVFKFKFKMLFFCDPREAVQRGAESS